MNGTVLTKTYKAPPLCQKEIYRYAGCRQPDKETEELLNFCVNTAEGKLNYSVCYTFADVSVNENFCDLGFMQIKSKDLSANLNGCKKVLIFAATVGVELDRLIMKYSRISPSKALMLQALGAERIEALCDVFCSDLGKELKADFKPRFSPGYGDLPLGIQKQFFAILDCPKRIGLSLNESMLMTPTKSVTAIVGITEEKGKQTEKNKCSSCNKKDCFFRGQ